MAMNRRQLPLVTASLVATWLLATGASAASLAGFDLGWHVIAGGGGRSASASYAVNGSIAQPAAGGLSGPDYRLSGGFWSGIGAEPPVPTPTGTLTPTSTPTATPVRTATPTSTVSPTLGQRAYLPVILKSHP